MSHITTKGRGVRVSLALVGICDSSYKLIWKKGHLIAKMITDENLAYGAVLRGYIKNHI